MKMVPNLLPHFESRNFAETTVKRSVEQKIEKIILYFLHECIFSCIFYMNLYS